MSCSVDTYCRPVQDMIIIISQLIGRTTLYNVDNNNCEKLVNFIVYNEFTSEQSRIHPMITRNRFVKSAINSSVGEVTYENIRQWSYTHALDLNLELW